MSLGQTSIFRNAIVFAILLPALFSQRPFVYGYNVVASADANNFFSMFDFVPSFSDGNGVRDYSMGFSNYLNRSEALSSGLAQTSGDRVRLGVDTNTVLDQTLPVKDPKYGRNSIRVQSKFTFDTGLLILDFTHMPRGDCGVWAAFWTINNDADESSKGAIYSEIDIAEGVHLQTTDIVTLHTDKRQDCSFIGNGGQTGTRAGTSCKLDNDVSTYGCEVYCPEGTYGDAINKIGGGIYAMELQFSGIKVWQFMRNQIPRDIASEHPNPDSWPKPIAFYDPAKGNCDVSTIFKKQSTILNINFCGDSGNPTWTSGDIESCKAKTNVATCNQYVAKNPKAFIESYWEINSLKLFQ